MAERDEFEDLDREEEESDDDLEGLDLDLVADFLAADRPLLMRVALERAARQGERDLVQKLVEEGTEIGLAMHAAAEGGHEEVVNYLLEHGAPVSARHGNGNTPLHYAAKGGNAAIVQRLLLKGAEIDASNNLVLTPLYVAADGGHVAAALALMTAGANVNPRWSLFGNSVLQRASERGDVDIMRAAIERGADLDVVDGRGQTLLHAAASSNNPEAIDVLVEAGANIEAQHAQFRSTPLQAAALEVKLEAMLALLKHGANICARDMFGDTPLHSAAYMAGRKAGIPDVVDSLLRSGADETILNDRGSAAADLISKSVDNLSLAKDLDRVRELLAKAPADRAWKRRGYVVLCRAHPERMRQIQGTSTAHISIARSADGEATLGRTEEASACTGALEASPVGGRGGGDWAVAVAMVLRMQEEGVFRKIMGYV